ncbi:hypothetical protein RvY_17492 [Ramazzottius varieornatus]|uniref:Uncharacterized protein n=1 Tax=Ramazzottius varieornatus TaxID=947166 RepID=A0A1D1W2P4_RAMVA|nr:hypothetical protein RvY_17492 [Ramazzottius varieornatus]
MDYAMYQPGKANDVWPDGRGDWHLEHRSAEQKEWQDSTGRKLEVIDCAFLAQFLTLLPQVPKALFTVPFDFKGRRDWRQILAPQEELAEISSDLLKFKERTSPF